MTLADTSSVLTSWLKSRHIKVLPEWTEACIDWIQNECQDQELTIDRLKEVVYNQWLDSDLAEIALPGLPEGLTQAPKRGFRGAYTLQINSIQDVGSSAYSQLVKIKGKENENVSVTAATQVTQNRFEPKPSRMLMMLVTDGHQTLQAMEYQPIAALNTDTPPGTKILLHGDIMCRLGVLTLTGGHVTVLGGEVESLMEENSQDKLLARIIGASLDDIPGGTAKPTQQVTAPNRGERDTNTTVGNGQQQQQPPGTAQFQPSRNSTTKPEDDFDDMMDEEILAGIDEEVLRELEESEYCSSKKQEKTSSVLPQTKQPPPPEWPSDEDTDEEMLAAMIDNLEEQIKARGEDTAVSGNSNTARAPSHSARARRHKLSSSANQRARADSSHMKQVPINSFMKPKRGSNDATAVGPEANESESRLSSKGRSSSSQFSAVPKQLPCGGGSSFVKAAPIQAAGTAKTASATGGFVRAVQSTVAAPKLRCDQSSKVTSVMDNSPKSGFVKAQIAPLAPAVQVAGKSQNQTHVDVTRGVICPSKDRVPAQGTSPTKGKFIKAGSAVSSYGEKELGQLPQGAAAEEVPVTPIKPFVQGGAQHQKVAVATRFSKDEDEERRRLSLKRRRNSSSAGAVPFRYLADVMDIITDPTEEFVFDIRGFIMTLLSSLSKEGNQWSLRVKLNDGSASLDAVLGNEVLENLIGFSVSQMKRMRSSVESPKEKAAVELVQKNALDQCRKKLVDLCEIMTVQVTPGESPVIISTRKVTQTDVEQMKKSLHDSKTTVT